MNLLAAYIVPCILLLVSVLIFSSKKDLFSAFSEGIAEGMDTTVKILPTLLLLTVAVRMLSASGALPFLCKALSPFCKKIGLDANLLPILLLRPFSGSGSTALLTELYKQTSPDSFSSRAAAVLMGSSDTIFYTVSVYFAAVGEKKTGRTLPAAFCVLLFCTALSVFLTKLFFGG